MVGNLNTKLTANYYVLTSKQGFNFKVTNMNPNLGFSGRASCTTLVVYCQQINMLHDPAAAETITIVSPLISTAHTAGLSVVPPAWIQCLPPHLSLHCPPCSVDYCLWFPPLCSSHNHCCTVCHLVSHVSAI